MLTLLNLSKTRSSLLAIGLTTLFLSACSAFGDTKDITQILEEGVVKITYGNESGHATGFFIKGGEEQCTVLTVAHAVPEDREVRVTAYDNELFEIAQIQRAGNADLAVMTFDVAGEESCPYTALKLGNSDKVKVDDVVKMAGYPERAGAERLVLQFPSGQITRIEKPPLPDGYAISYDMTTVGGMSGAPVTNAKGKVIGVHGLTDSELVSISRAQQSSLTKDQKDEVAEAEERVAELTRINHYKWGIPIATFVSQRSALFAKLALPGLRQEANELLRSEKYEEALPFLDKVIEISLDHEDAWLYTRFPPFLLIEERRYVAMVASYDRALKIGPDDVSVWIDRGNALRQLRYYEEAIASYDNAIEIDPDDAKAWYGRALALKDFVSLEGKRYEEAITSYDNALKIDPDNADAWYDRGNLLDELERYEEAIASYEKAIEIDLDNADAWDSQGGSLKQLERYEEAIASYEKALEIDPGDVLLWMARGRLLEQLERYEGAITSYEKALEIDPDGAYTWNDRGRALEQLGRDEEALKSYEKSISINPDNDAAINNLNRLKNKLNYTLHKSSSINWSLKLMFTGSEIRQVASSLHW